MERKGSHGSSTSPRGLEAARWHELRSLLTGPEQRQLEQILKRLDDPVRRAEELANALPDALSMSVNQDNRIARALQPTMDTALKSSVRKNPKAVADAIFPALGPAIRKAITAALMGMVQSLNHVLNQSFSIQSIKWRLEALRTQRPFAEIVLLHTLIYRVEEIFLIHRQTGLVLQHVASEQVQDRDPDLVSGMLTAIQDFVQDSFDPTSGELLDTLRMDGDHSIWIEQGSQVIMAVVIRGTPPMELRNQFRELLDKVHVVYVDILDGFDGQVAPFVMIRPELEDALSVKVRTGRTRISPFVWILMMAVVGAAIFGGVHIYRNHRHWQDLLAQLHSENGIVVTTAKRYSGRYWISGLKDPMARNPDAIIAASRINPDRVQTQWQPYQALDDAMVLRRALDVLDPPATVELTFAQGALAAEGQASHNWVKRFRQLAPTIAGVDGFDDRRLIDEEMRRLVSDLRTLEKLSIHFQLGQARLTEDQERHLGTVVETLQHIQHLSRAMPVSVTVTIVGHTDASGATNFNMLLSQQRAQAVQNHLIRKGIDPVLFHAIGAGPMNTPAISTMSPHQRRVLRHVTFRFQLHAEQVTP